MKRLIPLGIFGVLIVFLVIGLSLKPKEIPSPLIGKVAPTFSLPVLNQENQIFTPLGVSAAVQSTHFSMSSPR